MKYQELFSNRVAVLGTMHQKERAIAPILENELGIRIIVPDNFNTDNFGTFTREIKRPETQIITARLKAQNALDITGKTLAIASEGSFVPHPVLPYLYCNKEIVILIDKENDLEIIGEEFSLETNFNHQVVDNLQQAQEFALKVGFPEHGLIIWFEKSESKSNEIIKGITTEAKFLETINFSLENSTTGQVHIETDMRAIYNPTRMKNIEKATRDLLTKIKNLCPNCSTPGFAITERIQGLPCELCLTPTTLIRSVIYQCKKCGFSQKKLFPNNREFADPAQCMYCNP
jgi:uncharacterized protein DUF6671